MRPFDSVRLRDSYIALLSGMVPEKRKELWVKGERAYPEMANYLWEHFSALDERDTDFERNRDRIGGAMFLFLALVNATLDHPLVGGPFKALAPAKSPIKFPRFGNLPALE